MNSEPSPCSQPHSLEEDRLLAAISSRLGSTGQQESAGGGGGDVAEHALSADVQQWRVDWRDIKLERVIGGGSFGKVYLGTWKETQARLGQVAAALEAAGLIPGLHASWGTLGPGQRLSCRS